MGQPVVFRTDEARKEAAKKWDRIRRLAETPAGLIGQKY